MNGLSFCQLNESQQRYGTDKIIFNGAAISGSPLPQTEGFAQVIANEIVIFLLGYLNGELTLEEVLEAIRFNAICDLRYPGGEYVDRPVFSGNCFHVSFLAKIVHNYTALRNSLDRKLQNLIDGY